LRSGALRGAQPPGPPEAPPAEVPGDQPLGSPGTLPAPPMPGTAPPGLIASPEAAREVQPGPIPGLPRPPPELAPPGSPPRFGRPLPGTILDPGASGPGIATTSAQPFLGGALDPR